MALAVFNVNVFRILNSDSFPLFHWLTGLRYPTILEYTSTG